MIVKDIINKYYKRNKDIFPKLRKAIAEKNLFGKDGIIYNVHRKDVGEDRNYWTEQQIRNIKSW